MVKQFRRLLFAKKRIVNKELKILMKRRLKQMKEEWTEKEMEILKEAYPVKKSKVDNSLLDKAKETMPTSRKAKLNGKQNPIGQMMK